MRRVQQGKRRRGPMAKQRNRFASGVVLGAVWQRPVTCATWLTWRPANALRQPWAVN